jgi:hypothetical protein
MVWFHAREDIRPLAWGILYGLPTLVFLILSVATLGFSVANAAFQMPVSLVIARAIAGYMYAFVSLLYTQLGTPQEVDRLKDRDQIIAGLRKHIEVLTGELTEQKRLSESAKRAKAELETELNRSSDTALEAYGQDTIAWLRSGIKTVSVEEINRFTGHSKRRIKNAIDARKLLIAPRGDNLILVSSLRKWLEEVPPPEIKAESILHIVNG